MDIVTRLDEVIDARFDDLEELGVASKEYTDGVNNVTKLVDRALEYKKLKMSEAQNEKQMKEERKARLVKNCIDIGSVVLPLAVTVWGACISLEFEKNDVMSTSIGKKFMDKLISKK